MSSEEKRYAQLPRSSVCLYAESDGHASLPDSVAALLAEDSNYRLREIIQSASQLMRHAKRKRLTTADINQALTWSQVQPLYGYECADPLNSTFLREVDLFVPDDSEVNLMTLASEEVADQGGTKAPYFTMQWLAVEGVAKGQPSSSVAVEGPDGHQLQQQQQQQPSDGGVSKKKQVVIPQPQQQQQQQQGGQVQVSECLMSYYDQITQAILGSDQDLLLVALEDLQTNDRLTPLLPYLLNFVSVGVKKMGHDLTQLTKLLHAVQSLVDNPSLYLGTQPYLTLLVQSVLYCVLEPLAATLNPGQDHWTFRNSAARLLVHTLRRWSTSTNQLWCHTGQILRDCFGDLSKPFSTHYGALVAIQAMGLAEVEQLVLPKVESYWPHLHRALEGSSSSCVGVPGISPQVKADAHKVRGTLLLLSEDVLKWRLKSAFPEAWSLRERDLGHPVLDGNWDPRQTPPFTNDPQVKLESRVKQEGASGKTLENPLHLYGALYEVFGDALAIRMPCLPWVERIRPSPPAGEDRKPSVLLFSNPPELMQTGEEMLEAFYEGVCEDESARSPANSMDEDNSYEENSPMSDEAPAVELQIRSTISDPALGIKLTIAKLRRDQAPAPPPREQSPKRKKVFRNDLNAAEVFERCPLRPVSRPLVFNFEGGTPIPLDRLRRNTVWSVAEPPPQTWKLGTRMKKTGRKKQRSKPTVQIHMANVLYGL